MKIIFLTNLALPEIAEKENLIKSNYGGWLVRTVEEISKDANNELLYVFPCSKLVDGDTERYSYKGFIAKNETEIEEDKIKYFSDILEKFMPDIIHIWGTEYPHSLEMVMAAQKLGCISKVVISLQGLCSEYEKVYEAGLPKVLHSFKTLKEIIRKNDIRSCRKVFWIKGQNEIKALSMAKNVIGRTQWDKDCALKINDSLKYYKCNENLRRDFYSGEKWSIGNCIPQSVFVSQASYPIKGFHQLLKAAKILKKEYKNFTICVTGNSIVPTSFRGWIGISAYNLYLTMLIKKARMTKSIRYLGSLDANAMKEQYLKCNAFASVASIENSPNSVGEAMTLGVPIVCSNVGGCESIICDQSECLMYNYDDVNALADSIKRIFDDTVFAQSIGENARKHAQITHDVDANNRNLIDIYSSIIKENAND